MAIRANRTYERLFFVQLMNIVNFNNGNKDNTVKHCLNEPDFLKPGLTKTMSEEKLQQMKKINAGRLIHVTTKTRMLVRVSDPMQTFQAEHTSSDILLLQRVTLQQVNAVKKLYRTNFGLF